MKATYQGYQESEVVSCVVCSTCNTEEAIDIGNDRSGASARNLGAKQAVSQYWSDDVDHGDGDSETGGADDLAQVSFRRPKRVIER